MMMVQESDSCRSHAEQVRGHGIQGASGQEQGQLPCAIAGQVGGAVAGYTGSPS